MIPRGQHHHSNSADSGGAGLASAEPPGAPGLPGEWLRPWANDDAEGLTIKEVPAPLVAIELNGQTLMASLGACPLKRPE